MGQDREPRLLPIVRGHEPPPQEWPHAKRVEEPSVDQRRLDLFWLDTARQRELRVVPAGQPGQRAALLTPRGELRVQHHAAWVLFRRQRGRDELARLSVRERPQQFGPDEGEHGDTAGDTEPDAKQRGEGEERAPKERTTRM